MWTPRRRPWIAIAAGAALAGLGAAPSLAQAVPKAYDYAGGRLSPGNPASGREADLLTVRVGHNHSHVPYRLETAISCGRAGLFGVELQKHARLAGGRLRDSRSLRLARYPRANVRVDLRLDLTLTPQGGRGTLRISGRVLDRGRLTRCTSDRVRRVVLLARSPRPIAGAAARPSPSQTFAGAARRLAGPLRPGIMVRVNRTGRQAGAVWDLMARCGQGRPARFRNFSPFRPIRGSRVVVRERFTVRFVRGIVAHYRVTFDGRFRTGGVTGTTRLQVRYTAQGKTYARCDSGAQAFDALPVPGGLPT